MTRLEPLGMCVCRLENWGRMPRLEPLEMCVPRLEPGNEDECPRLEPRIKSGASSGNEVFQGVE